MRAARHVVLWVLPALFATAAAACSPQYPEQRLQGRADTIEFSNRAPGGRHENWAPARARLTMHAAFAGQTDEYGHNIMGPVRDAKALTIHIRQPGSGKISCPAEAILPEGEVFEDIAPRLADLDGDGLPEVIVVQTSTRLGARLAVYDRRARLVAATPHIGRSFRWLAPVGAADLDGDGKTELGYIDRPHLAKTLRIWRYDNGKLVHVADHAGLTNHRIGEDFISGGIRDCGDGPEIVTATGDWSRLMASRLSGGRITVRDIGPHTGPDGFAAALACRSD